MALCSGDSQSFIYKEEGEIKCFHPRALLVFHLLTKSGYLLTGHSSSCQTSSLWVEEKRQQALEVYTSHYRRFPFHWKVRQYLSVQGRTHDLHVVQHEKQGFSPLMIHDRGKKNSSLAIWKHSWIQNLSMYTSFGHFGTPHNTCSSLLPGSEWRRAALWWGVLLLLLHFLPLVWHSRSLNYVWTASNILYHQAPM